MHNEEARSFDRTVNLVDGQSYRKSCLMDPLWILYFFLVEVCISAHTGRSLCKVSSASMIFLMEIQSQT